MAGVITDRGTISELRILITTTDAGLLWSKVEESVRSRQLMIGGNELRFAKFSRIELTKGFGVYPSDKTLIMAIVDDGIGEEELSELVGKMITLLVREHGGDWTRIGIMMGPEWRPEQIQKETPLASID